MSSWTGYTVAFETHKAEFDPAALFRGLPDDRCQCPHWGVVISGTIVYRYVDREENLRRRRRVLRRARHIPLLSRHRADRVQPDRSAAGINGRPRQESGRDEGRRNCRSIEKSPSESTRRSKDVV